LLITPLRLSHKPGPPQYNEAARHLELLNLKETVQNSVDSTNLLNVALESVLFLFRKVSEAEMIIADQLKDILRKTRESLGGNFDPLDPVFISLYEELKRLFDKKNLDEITQEEMRQNIGSLQQIFDKAAELNRKNNLLKVKYEHDAKYARIHKRILEKGTISRRESEIFEIMMDIKKQADDKVLINTRLLQNEVYFTNMLMPMIISGFSKAKVNLEPDSARFINAHVAKEYMNEYKGVYAW
jgi:type I restriction enzyme, R subunit